MIVSVNGLTTALHCLDRRLCIVSTDGSALSRRTALHRLYERLYERLYDGPATALQRLCNGSTNGSLDGFTNGSLNGSTNGSMNGSTTTLRRLYDGSTIAYTIVSANGSALSQPTALHRLDEQLCIVSINGSASSNERLYII